MIKSGYEARQTIRSLSFDTILIGCGFHYAIEKCAILDSLTISFRHPNLITFHQQCLKMFVIQDLEQFDVTSARHREYLMRLLECSTDDESNFLPSLQVVVLQGLKPSILTENEMYNEGKHILDNVIRNCELRDIRVCTDMGFMVG